MNNIILYGFKSSGKTSVGQQIAQQLNMNFIDVDRVIEKIYGKRNFVAMGARKIYHTEGDKYFRNLEKDAILSLINVENTVIATGGGSVLDPNNVAVLKKIGKLVYLKTTKETIKTRLLSNQSRLLDDKDFTNSFETMYESRIATYESIADMAIDTNEKDVETIADEIIKKCMRK